MYAYSLSRKLLQNSQFENLTFIQMTFREVSRLNRTPLFSRFCLNDTVKCECIVQSFKKMMLGKMLKRGSVAKCPYNLAITHKTKCLRAQLAPEIGYYVRV